MLGWIKNKFSGGEKIDLNGCLAHLSENASIGVRNDAAIKIALSIAMSLKNMGKEKKTPAHYAQAFAKLKTKTAQEGAGEVLKNIEFVKAFIICAFFEALQSPAGKGEALQAVKAFVQEFAGEEARSTFIKALAGAGIK